MSNTMKAWQFNSTSGKFEDNLTLNESAPILTVTSKKVLVKVISAALNPVDYKMPEFGMMARVIFTLPATPAVDFCGKVVEVGDQVKEVKKGDLVFGAMSPPLVHGTLAEYTLVPEENLAIVPSGVLPDHAASIGVVGMTAYQSISPHVKPGDKIFINGGSGGCGVWGIQIAKVLGCHVTTSCSDKNVKLCKELGADEVLDYKSVDVVNSLKEKGEVFKLVVDNVGSDSSLYKASSSFLVPDGNFIQVGVSSGFSGALSLFKNFLLPSFLGGGTRKYTVFLTKTNQPDDLKKLGSWVSEGKIKAVIDSTFEFQEAKQAYEKLKTGRSVGKIVVHAPN